jgi:AcrR family transcriptional regulator
LDAAAQVLIRDGYASTTTNRIAERAGVSVGSIYQYFDDKDAVFALLIDRELEAVVTIFDADPHQGKDGLIPTLRRLLTVAVEAWSYGPLLYRQLEQVPDAALQRRVVRARTRLTEFIRSLLESHRDELRVRDLDVATFVVINASPGLSTNAPSEMYGESLVATTVELLERYLVA